MKLFQALQAVNHVIENNDQLEFAKNNLSTEQFDKLNRSRRKLILFQTFPWILAVLAVVIVLIFVPSVDVKMTILLFGAAVYILFYTLWLIISQFIVGRLWQKYVKWYRQGGSMEELYSLLK